MLPYLPCLMFPKGVEKVLNIKIFALKFKERENEF